jgi:queuine tRNA-ribosyltransferase
MSEQAVASPSLATAVGAQHAAPLQPARLNAAGTAGTFEVVASAPDSRARCGRLHTAHGVVHTPAFMPVATQGTVKGLTPAQLQEAGAEIILANAYHLALRPGAGLIREVGGLHRFMGWNGAILTDSGGYQIFSLAPLRKLSDEGVEFRSHLDGTSLFLTPDDVVRLQVDLGVDIIMTLDECVGANATRQQAEAAVRRTFDWAVRSRAVQTASGQLMFGIVQGSTYKELRRRQVDELVGLDFPGYAVGGLSVGEQREITMTMAEETVGGLPGDRPRYLMGVGPPATGATVCCSPLRGASTSAWHSTHVTRSPPTPSATATPAALFPVPTCVTWRSPTRCWVDSCSASTISISICS